MSKSACLRSVIDFALWAIRRSDFSGRVRAAVCSSSASHIPSPMGGEMKEG